jgi:ABC-type proline/glycine betaine transport system permease subunit
MAENHQIDPQPGVASMVEGILEDAQKLVRQEIALAQHEIAGAWDKGKNAVALLTSALAVFIVAGVLLGFLLVKLLQQYLLPNHELACYAIGGGLFVLLAGALAYCGFNQVSKVHVSLPQTAETLHQDAQAVGAALSGGRHSPENVLQR